MAWEIVTSPQAQGIAATLRAGNNANAVHDCSVQEAYWAGTRFLIQDSFFPPIGGWLIIVFLTVLTLVSLKLMRKPLKRLLHETTEIIEYNSTRERATAQLHQKIRASAEIEDIKSVLAVIHQKGLLTRQEYKAIRDKEIQKLEHTLVLTLQRQKNQRVSAVAKEYLQLMDKVSQSRSMTESEKIEHYKKIDQQFDDWVKTMDNEPG
ncbi:MAG: hypothetical protein MI864_06235 [Pseudomonadales bacterium]|nr:hypothetical protein [Pseudomonadales bacterium]